MWAWWFLHEQLLSEPGEVSAGKTLQVDSIFSGTVLSLSQYPSTLFPKKNMLPGGIPITPRDAGIITKARRCLHVRMYRECLTCAEGDLSSNAGAIDAAASNNGSGAGLRRAWRLSILQDRQEAL